MHVGGYSRQGIIRRIKGATPNTPNDDMIALNADDDVERVINLGMRRGPIRDITVEDMEAAAAYNFVRILSDTSPVENVAVRRVSGGCRFYAVNINEWDFRTGSGDIRNIRLEHFEVRGLSNGRPLIDVALNVQNLQIRDFRRLEGVDDAKTPTLVVRNGFENIVLAGDRPAQRVKDFRVEKGCVKEIQINPTPMESK